MNNKAAKGTWAAAFTVASVWFGTHVGGGFASGNQVVSYFAQYGMWAAVLPLVAMGILALVMYTVMKFAKLNGFTNYKDTFSALYPKPWMEVFFEIFYIVILLAAVAAAVAGAGEVLANFFGVDYSVTANKLIFNLIIVAVLIILSIFGVKLVIFPSQFLSPPQSSLLPASQQTSTQSAQTCLLRTVSRQHRMLTMPAKRSGAAFSFTQHSSAYPSPQ